MNKLHEYMKQAYDMKSFTHVPQEKQSDLKTKTIQGHRFYLLPNGNKLPSITSMPHLAHAFGTSIGAWAR